MRWTDGRSKGTTSVVKRSAVKNGIISVGDQVQVVWGKGNKTYCAEVLDDARGLLSSIAQRKQQPLKRTSLTSKWHSKERPKNFKRTISSEKEPATNSKRWL